MEMLQAFLWSFATTFAIIVVAAEIHRFI